MRDTLGFETNAAYTAGLQGSEVFPAVRFATGPKSINGSRDTYWGLKKADFFNGRRGCGCGRRHQGVPGCAGGILSIPAGRGVLDGVA